MYGKFFASTFTGSMLGAGAEVFAVWAYVIANTVNAAIELNPTLLAAVLGMKPEAVADAISYLCAPDPMSRNPAEDGRRLVKDGMYQYRVVSHDIYRAVRDEDARREYNRKKMREFRAKRKSQTMSNPDVIDGEHCEPIQKQKQKQKAESLDSASAESSDQLTGFTPDADPPKDLEHWFGSGRESADGK